MINATLSRKEPYQHHDHRHGHRSSQDIHEESAKASGKYKGC